MYKITYHKKVIEVDIPKLGKKERIKISETIEGKLFESPEIFGKYLAGSLFPCRSLRIGDYRVLYEILKNKEVFILMIEHRSRVYQYILKRMK